MPKQPAPSDLADKFMLRMPDGMRDRIANAAKANGRSMNSEIVARLEGSFENEELMPRATKALDELQKDIAEGFEEQKQMLEFFRFQMAGFRAVVDAIAETDGTLDPSLFALIKRMADEKPQSSGTGGPGGLGRFGSKALHGKPRPE